MVLTKVWVTDDMGLNLFEIRFVGVLARNMPESSLAVREYAKLMGVSERTVNRAVRSLLQKNLISVRYGRHRIMNIKLLDLDLIRVKYINEPIQDLRTEPKNISE